MPAVPTRDGLMGSRVAGASVLYAVGGWFRGLPGSRLQLILDGDDSRPITLGAVANSYQFYGDGCPVGIHAV